jgi:hydroxyacylglutathione hydrolase
MQVIPIKAFKDNYIWMLLNSAREAIAVDPGDGAVVLNWLTNNQVVLKAIFITHHHHDHVGGIHVLRQRYPVAVYGPANESIAGLSHLLREKDCIDLPLFPSFMVFEVPGHTLGHIVYYGANALFCGDTLFGAGCGRLFEGSPQQMYASLTKIAALPDQTLCYAAHEYTMQNLRFAQLIEPDNTNIAMRLKQVEDLMQRGQPTLPASLAEEKATNPFLRTKEPSLIKALEQRLQSKLPDFVSVFSQLRALRNTFTG